MSRAYLFYLIYVLSYILMGPCVLDKSVDIVPIQKSRRADKVIYICGGMCCRTANPFKFVTEQLDKIPKDVPVYLVEYKNTGLWMCRARRAIRAHRKKYNYTSASFIVVSMGYQLAAGVKKDGDKVIALNPCVGLITLKPLLAVLMAIFLIPVRLLALGLGWLLLLPVVKVDGPAYSIQLWLDQLSACGSLIILLRRFKPDVLFLSNKDGLVNNDVLKRLLVGYDTKVVQLDTGHFGVNANEAEYKDAVDYI